MHLDPKPENHDENLDASYKRFDQSKEKVVYDFGVVTVSHEELILVTKYFTISHIH